MNFSKPLVILESLITLLLVFQVAFSVLIFFRLQNLDSNIIQLQNINRDILVSGEPSSEEPVVVIDNVSVDDDPWLGSEDAPITIVEFSDYQCPYCADAVATVEELLSDYEGQLQFVYRDFAVFPLGPKAAEAADCAGDQGEYWGMYKAIFANQERLETEDDLRTIASEIKLDLTEFNACLESGKYVEEVLHDTEEGKNYQVVSTPTFYINGLQIRGHSPEALRQEIDRILNP